MPSVVFHLEDPHRCGITISMLDPWRILWKAAGIEEFDLIDMTTDGYFGGMGDAAVTRHRSLDAFEPEYPVVLMETGSAVLLCDFRHPQECHYVFGPSMGLSGHEDWLRVSIPMVGLEARDAGAIVAGHRVMQQWQ
ncbi:MAG: hypothetical protein R3268_00125 [Acidiferrobacterales bacterium]|nr:hypothetical protein [Acidiferrobacterales bacterium]